MLLLCYLLCVFLILMHTIYYHFTKKLNYWKDKNVPGPEPVPIFGNIKEAVLRRAHPTSLFTKIYNDFANQKVVGIYRTITPCLLLRDLDVIKHVTIKDFDMFIDRGFEFSKEGLGANLFDADGETWRVLRSQFTSLFTSGKLRNMLYLIVERGNIFMDYVDNLVHKQTEQEVHILVQKFMMSSIAACAFGISLNIDSDEMNALKKIDHMIFKASYVKEMDLFFPGVLKKFNMSFFPVKVNKFFHSLVKNVISQRNGQASKRKDFIDLILELREEGKVHGKKYDDGKELVVQLTDGIIAAQAFVFYAAGYETSATTVTYMLYHLAQDPEMQQKVISEIDEVLDKYNGQITYDGLQDLTYLGKVFDETLRMYPPIDPLHRHARANYKIPGTDVELEKGKVVLIPVSAIHHDEKYYPDPWKFDPERFSAESIKHRHPCAYLPFGAGPRNCLGLRFARVQSQVCVVKLFSKYRLEPTSKTQKSINYDPLRVFSFPQGGIHLNLIPRK